jgi:hypothetical protein
LASYAFAEAPADLKKEDNEVDWNEEFQQILLKPTQT